MYCETECCVMLATASYISYLLHPLIASFYFVLDSVSRYFINSVQPKYAVFRKATTVYSNVLGLRIHSPLSHWLTQGNFHSYKLHLW